MLGIVLGILSITISLVPYVYELVDKSGFFAFIYSSVYWAFYYLKYNYYLLFIPLVAYLTTICLDKKNMPLLVVLVALFAAYVGITLYVFYNENYVWLDSKGQQAEKEGNLIAALRYYSHSKRLQPDQDNIPIRRAYNKLLTSRKLWSAYTRQKKTGLDISVLETLCKSALLNREYRSEVQNIAKIQGELSKKLENGIAGLRDENIQLFKAELMAISKEIKNYGFSESILLLLEGKGIIHSDIFYISPYSEKEFMHLLKNPATSVGKVVAMLSSPFDIRRMCTFENGKS